MKIKKLICMLLAGVLVCPNLSGETALTHRVIEVQAAAKTIIGDYNCRELEDGTLEIIAYDGTDTELVVPGKIGGKQVTGIGDMAFEDCSNLTNISLPKGLTTIGGSAFYGCSSLSSIKVPDSVIYISGNAFTGTKWLENEKKKNPYVIVNHILIDGSGCRGEVNIPKGVTAIGDYAFSGCENLTNINIPEGVTDIGYLAFENCSSLTSINIPEGVTNIGSLAFSCCSSLAVIDIPESVTNIGNDAFDRTKWLENERKKDPCVTVNHILIDGSGCSGEVDISQGVTAIGDYAFSSCSGLTAVNIPEGVTSIGNRAFYWCRGLTDVKLPQSVTNIGRQAFYWCSNLVNINIPDGMTSIAGELFFGCSSLKNVIIPEGVTDVGSGAFYGCSSLTNVNIPSGVTDIGDGAFGRCENLVDLNIPVKADIGGGAFYKTKWLEEKRKENPCVVINHILIDGKKCSGSVKVPEGVTYIGREAFLGCSGLKSITIPESVRTIGAYAFSDCSNLKSIDIPKRVTEIEYGTFSGCSSLGSIKLPDSITSIGNSAFRGCSSLRNVVLPGNVKSLGESVFEKCSSLTTVNIPGKVESIGASAFWDCSNLTRVSIPESVISIGYGSMVIEDNIFYGCGSDVELKVVKGSLAESYARKFGMKYSYVSSTSSNNLPKTIKLSKTKFTYNSKNQKPSVIIKDSKGKTLNKTDYTVSYPKSMKNVGKYMVTIQLKGNYSGTVKKTFTIVPKGTSISKITPKKKGFAVKWKKQTTQTTGYEIAYSTDKKFSKKNTKVVTVGKNKTTLKSVSKLKVKKKYYVRIRTYKTVKGKKYYSGWSKVKNVTTKK